MCPAPGLKRPKSRAGAWRIFRWSSAARQRGRETAPLRSGWPAPRFFKECDDLATVTRAWKALRQIVGRHGDGLPLLGSPGNIGVYLLERLLPAGASYPLQSEEMRTLLYTHSPQPRKECLTAPDLERIPAFHYLDGRWMYAACLVYSFPVGEPNPRYARPVREISAWLVPHHGHDPS